MQPKVSIVARFLTSTFRFAIRLATMVKESATHTGNPYVMIEKWSEISTSISLKTATADQTARTCGTNAVKHPIEFTIATLAVSYPGKLRRSHAAQMMSASAKSPRASVEMILVKNHAPSPYALGQSNGLVMFAMCGTRALAPAFVRSVANPSHRHPQS